MVVPANITPSDSKRARRISGSLAAVLIVAIMVVAILVLAIPRFSAAVAFFPFSERRYVVTNVITDDAATNQRYIDHARAASGFFAHNTIYADIGLAELHLLETGTGEGTAADALLSQASRDIVESIALAPSNPYAWARLALVRQWSGAPQESVRKALFNSILVGPNEPEMLLGRIRLGIAYWRYLTLDERGKISDLIRFAIQGTYRGVIEVLSGDVWARAVIWTALADDPRLLGIYKSILLKPRR